MTTINVPKVYWLLGDPYTTAGDAVVRRPLYYCADGSGVNVIRVGEVNREHAEIVIAALNDGRE